MPAYREGPPKRALAPVRRVKRHDTAVKARAVRIAAKPQTARAARYAGFKAGQQRPPVTSAGRAVSGAVKVGASKLTRRTPQQRESSSRKRVSARAFRGEPGTLDTGRFPYTHPDLPANARYEGYAERLWGKAKREYGLPADAPMPKLATLTRQEARESFPDSGGEGAYTDFYWRRPAQRVVRVSPTVVRASSSRTNDPRRSKDAREGRDFAHSVLLHEWAHANQRVRLPDWLAEGGAEAFSQDVSPRLHLVDPPGFYGREVRRARRKGSKFIHRGQFKKGR